jgi:signal transduction histidine kinase
MFKNPFSFIPSQSETANVVKSMDWSKHQLGNPEDWDPALKIFFGFMFSSQSQLFLFWGDELSWFYNDAFLTSFDKEKHPHSMGQNGELVWEVSWPLVGANVRDVLRSGKDFQYINRPIPNYRNGKIETVFWTYTLSPLFDLDGKVRGVVGNSMETTTENLDKQALAKAESQLGQAIAISKTGFYDWDIINDHIVFSQQMREDWGITASITLAEAITFIHPDDQVRVKALVDKSVKEKVPYKTVYRVIRPTDGKTVWLNVQGSVEYDHAGNPVRFFGTSVDITDVKENENRVEQEKKKFESVFQYSPAAMALWRGKEMIFEKVNPAYQAIFPNRQLEGLSICEALPELEGQGFREMLNSVLETGVPFTGKEVLAKMRSSLDGPLEDYYYDFSYVQFKDADGKPNGVYDHAVDVTEKVKAKAALQESIKNLEEEREMRERFVAALTHDLRTPLTAAKFSAQILARNPNDPVKVEKHSRRISLNIDRADNMIRDLLDAARIKAGQPIQLNLSECDLSSITQEVVNDLSSIHGFKIGFDGAEHITGFWDCNALRRTIENLISNAIKYGNHEKSVKIKIIEENNFVKIAVHNMGNPIPESEMSEIFDPFKRSKSTENEQKGWGLGLTLVKWFTTAHGGNVQVQSSETKGTTFVVHLPKFCKGPHDQA